MAPQFQAHPNTQAQAQPAPELMDTTYGFYPEPQLQPPLQPQFLPPLQDRPHLKRPFTSVYSSSPSLPVSSSAFGYGYGYGHGYSYGSAYGHAPFATQNPAQAFEHGFHKHDKTYAQRFQERLDGYNACREKELAAPFSPDRDSSYDSEHTRSLRSSPSSTSSEEEDDDASLGTCFQGCGCEGEDGDGDEDVDIDEDDNDDVGSGNGNADENAQSKPYPQPQGQQQDIPKQKTENYAPLSNEAISAILMRCAPHSPSAQAWVKAHRPSNVDHERKAARLRHQDDLRRRVLQLQPKSDWAMNRLKRGESESVKRSKFAETPANLASGNQMFMSKGVPRNEKDLDFAGFKHQGRTYILDEEDKQRLNIFMSTGRLQQVAGNEEASIILVQEFRRYFDISDD